MSFKYAKRMDLVKPSIIREFARLTAKPEIISFAGGAPASELFPIKELKEITACVLEKNGRSALQYSDTAGNVSLREKIVKRFGNMGVKTSVDNIHIISGSQQGLDFGAKIFLDPNDVVICERPTYLGAINAFRSYEAQFVDIPMDDDGMIMVELEKNLRNIPNCKLIYVIPDFQNPTGKTWSLERRRELVEIANQYNLPIIEDHPYGALRYEGEQVPPVKALDTEGRVIYLGTFSKIFCPGFRVAWIFAGKDVLEKYYMTKGNADLHTSSIAQAMINEYLETYDLDAHIENLKVFYKKRRDLMLNIMDQDFPSEAKYTRPKGGFFIWVELPERINTFELMHKALESKVAIVPGDPFYPNDGPKNTFRLSYSSMPQERIIKGMNILAKVLKEALAK